MALALAAAGCADGMEPVLPRLAEQIREAIAAPRSRKGPPCVEALQVRVVWAAPVSLRGGPCLTLRSFLGAVRGRAGGGAARRVEALRGRSDRAHDPHGPLPIARRCPAGRLPSGLQPDECRAPPPAPCSSGGGRVARSHMCGVV